MTDPYRFENGRLVYDHSAGAAYARALEARERAEAMQRARPAIVRVWAKIVGRA